MASDAPFTRNYHIYTVYYIQTIENSHTERHTTDSSTIARSVFFVVKTLSGSIVSRGSSFTQHEVVVAPPKPL